MNCSVAFGAQEISSWLGCERGSHFHGHPSTKERGRINWEPKLCGEQRIKILVSEKRPTAGVTCANDGAETAKEAALVRNENFSNPGWIWHICLVNESGLVPLGIWHYYCDSSQVSSGKTNFDRLDWHGCLSADAHH